LLPEQPRLFAYVYFFPERVVILVDAQSQRLVYHGAGFVEHPFIQEASGFFVILFRQAGDDLGIHVPYRSRVRNRAEEYVRQVLCYRIFFCLELFLYIRFRGVLGHFHALFVDGFGESLQARAYLAPA